MIHFTKRFTFLALIIISLCSINNIYAQFPSWGAVTPGTNGQVNSLVEFNGELIAAGLFTTPGRNIARYNGTKWDTLSRGLNDTVYSLAVYNNKLIAVGAFDSAGGVPCSNIAQWNGTSWSPVGLGTNNTIFAADTVAGALIIGGRFTLAGGDSCSHLARWEDSTWTPLGEGVNDNVYAFEQVGSGLFIGGAFTMSGTDTVNRIVRFDLDSSVYTPLGAGIDSGNVYAISRFQGVMYVGGDFLTIEGDTVNRIAIWNDTSWSPVGTGMNGPVRTFEAFGDGLLVIGGTFTNAGGTNANNIVACGGPSSFAPFGGGLGGTNPRVNDVMGWRGVTIAGGFFSNINVARWGLLPSVPELITPLEAENNVSLTPLFTWGQTGWPYFYTIQVARDANFLNLTRSDSMLTVTELQVPDTTELLELTTYFWRVRGVNGLGNGPYSLIRFFVTTTITGTVNTSEIPERFNLYQNFPNPFNPVTKIKFDLPNIRGNSSLKVEVFNINGQVVKELLNTDYAAGRWELSIDASQLASGIYFYKITASQFTQTRKMILIK
jgi:hypothetical protein